MFQPKTFVILMGLVGSATATRSSDVHMRVTNNVKQDTAPDGQCPNGGQSVSVVSWSMPGCIDAGVNMCVASDSTGTCPSGAHCDVVTYDASSSPVYGCLPGEWEPCDEPTTTCGDNETPVSVVGWTDSGCVSNDYDICVAGNYWGACPDDSLCAWVTYDQDGNDVYGCYDTTYGNDECVPVSVVGWEYNGCITEDDEPNMCVAAKSDGVCPDGAYCDVVAWESDDGSSWTEVYGCIDNYYSTYDDSAYASYQAPCDSGYTEIGVAGWSANGCVPEGSDVCVASNYNGTCAEYSTCMPVAYDDNWEYVWGCVGDWVEARHMSHRHKSASAVSKKSLQKALRKSHHKKHHNKAHHKTHHKKSHKKHSHN